MESIKITRTEQKKLTSVKVSIIDDLSNDYPQISRRHISIISGLNYSTYRNYKSPKRIMMDNKLHKHHALMKKIERIHISYQSLGYRKITNMINDNLKYDEQKVSDKVIYGLMRKMGIKSILGNKKKRYNNRRKDTNNIRDNILKGVFNPTRPNEILSLDVTEIKLQNNTKAYLSLCVDTYTGELIGASISNKQDYKHTRKTLEAIIRRKNRYNKEETTIIQTDQGWQYTLKVTQEILKANNIMHSMSGKGRCSDNHPIENVFGKIKREFIYTRSFNNLEELEYGLTRYIKIWNNKRPQAKLQTSPTNFRKKWEAEHKKAA